MSDPYRTSNSVAYEESWRVRLLRTPDRNGIPLGAGVLLSRTWVLTCAHTVLSPPDRAGVRARLDTVYVDVLRTASSGGTDGPVRARVVPKFFVEPTPDFGGDVALLELDDRPGLPHEVPVAVLHRQIPAPGEPVHFTGYPQDLPGGEHLDARLMGRGGPAPAPEWVQLDTQDSPYVVRHGYSGCGVVHSRSRRVIGILVHQFGTPEARVRRDHAYMIPTETVLRHLRRERLERLGLKITGLRAVSRDVAVAPDRTVSGRVPGLQRRLTRWLDGEPDTDPVEPVFAGVGEHDLRYTIRSVLTLADREQSPPTPSALPASAGEPQLGSIDIAVDATNRTVEELARQTADRIGLDVPEAEGTGVGAHESLLRRIAVESPPLNIAFLAVDRCASSDGEIMDLLRALRAGGETRLLLVFSDRRSPLLDQVRAEVMEPDWPARRAARLRARLDRLAECERRIREHPARPAEHAGARPAQAERLRAKLAQLLPGGLSYDDRALPHALFRITVDIEAALLETENREEILRRTAGPPEFVAEPPGDGLTDLPVVTVGAPDALVTARSGAKLTAGDLLHQQYEVVGPIGRGSHGQVYLARDLLLEKRPVALKGVLDPDNPDAVRQAHQERLRLVRLNHPSIIRVVNYARHPSAPHEFIVMEFADGAPLSWVADRIAERRPPFAGARVREFVVAYGLLILDALGHLHKEGLVYGDLSLTNVLHCRDGIKLIDVAGVRKPGEPGPVTHRPPGSGAFGEMTTAGDLYTVGAVLRELLSRDPEPSADIGEESLNRALERAMAEEPELRYASADEMAVQLRGVLRELRSLRLGEETYQPSTLFDPPAAALDGQLGKAPPLERWRTDRAPDRLGARIPDPAEAAVALPRHKPDVQDVNWKELQRTSYDDPAGLLQLSREWERSPELHLLRCRLHLQLGDLASAQLELHLAEERLGDRSRYDWRLDWHQGLNHLASGSTAEAWRSFDAVYRAIPGEYAPKLALGYCHEKLAVTPPAGNGEAEQPQPPADREGNVAQAKKFYEAVLQRNHAMGAAAFGLARIHLADDEWEKACAYLESVPPDSRHRTAARTAVVRIQVNRRSPVDAYAALHRLTNDEGLTDGQARDRIRTELLAMLLGLVEEAHREAAARDPLADLAGARSAGVEIPRTERQLRDELSASYRRLAKQVPRTDRPEDAALAEALLDRAFGTRPLGARHVRGRSPAWARWSRHMLLPGGEDHR
ncbi:tetratricopeptide repeat protein [Streptomyces sp. NPDC018833]|uniref:tetratricopeptide repeat protein n=1 Tax=Streptomyces sp. NPDC018833 TaxID=3365053 RepID=UPI0037BD0B7B